MPPLLPPQREAVAAVLVVAVVQPALPVPVVGREGFWYGFCHERALRPRARGRPPLSDLQPSGQPKQPMLGKRLPSA